MTIAADKITFEEHIKNPCVVDFYMTGCPACEKLSPVFEAASEKCDGISFVKVNLDDDITLAERYEVSHVPTLILFKEGKPVNINAGYLDRDSLSAFLKEGQVSVV